MYFVLNLVMQISRDGDVAALEQVVSSMPPDDVKDAVNEAEDSYEQKTPLHYAARYWHLPLVAKLLSLGAEINMADFYYRTALHYAVK
jgi:ankyrin repeat protein